MNASRLLRLEFHPDICLIYMSPLVKSLCKIREKNSRSHGQSENLQERINELIRAEQVRACFE